MSQKPKRRGSSNLKELEYDEEKSILTMQEYKPITVDIKDYNWTDKQITFIDLCLSKKTNYIFLEAPAGVGKSLMSLYIGLKLLNEGRIKNIVFCRQPVESSNYTLGYLKGELNDKMEPYLRPAMNLLSELISKQDIKRLTDGGYIQGIPIGFLKGLTFHKSLVICDEAEDLMKVDFRLAMTRLGKNSKMIFIGDSEQSNVKNNAFKEILEIFKAEDCPEHGIHCSSFNTSDIMRNTTIEFVLHKLQNIKK